MEIVLVKKLQEASKAAFRVLAMLFYFKSAQHGVEGKKCEVFNHMMIQYNNVLRFS